MKKNNNAVWRRFTATALGAGAIAVGAMVLGAPAAQADYQFDQFKDLCIHQPQTLDGRPDAASGSYSELRTTDGVHPSRFGSQLDQICRFYDQTGKYLNSATRETYDPIKAVNPNPGGAATRLAD
jgi:hypothetical protein